MDYTTITQSTFATVSLFLNLLLVFVPRKFLHSNSRLERTTRLLDLTTYFSLGVFSATCFIILLPHVLNNFIFVAQSFHWGNEFAYKVIFCVAMTGFFFVFLLEKLGEYCNGTYKEVVDNMTDPLDKPPISHPNHQSDLSRGNKEAESYVVTFQDDYDDEDEEEEDDDEINRANNENDKVTLKLNDEEDEDDDENASLVNKSILVKRNNKKGMERKLNKKVTFKKNTKEHNSNNRLVVGGRLHNSTLKDNNFNIRCLTLLVSMATHSFFEGLSVGLMTSLWPTIHLCFSITLHQILVSVVMGISLTRHRLNTSSFTISSFFFSASIPLGVLAGMAMIHLRDLNNSHLKNTIRLVASVLQSLTVGTFFYVIFVEVLPSETEKHRDILKKMFLLCGGFVLVCVLTFTLP